MASFKQPPKELILDFDATDDAVHGKQEGRFFHGYYDHYCFLPVYVFCQDQLLVLEKEFSVHYNQQEDTYTFHKQVVGPYSDHQLRS